MKQNTTYHCKFKTVYVGFFRIIFGIPSEYCQDFQLWLGTSLKKDCHTHQFDWIL